MSSGKWRIRTIQNDSSGRMMQHDDRRRSTARNGEAASTASPSSPAKHHHHQPRSTPIANPMEELARPNFYGCRQRARSETSMYKFHCHCLFHQQPSGRRFHYSNSRRWSVARDGHRRQSMARQRAGSKGGTTTMAIGRSSSWVQS
ncbi:hypothetical protein ACLOJK_022190 [Asimina triloba]